MKKILLMAAVAAAIMTSCSKSETIEQPGSRAIKFDNAVVSKGQTSLNAGQFNIFGFKNTTAVFGTGDIYNLGNDKYKRGNASNTPSDWTGMYYYDGISDYTFYGYAKTLGTTTYDAGTPANTAPTAFAADPAGAAANLTAGSEKIVFTSPANNNIDLVTMSASVLQAAQSTAQNKLVTFKHALTRVRFTAYTETYDALNLIRITSITFRTAKNQGEVAKADMGAGTMTATGSTAVTYTLNTAANFQTALTTTATTPATTTHDVFYVIPQALGNGDLVVAYTVDGVAATPKSFNLATAGPSAGPIVMESGQSYNFNIKINLNEITFNAQLEDWLDETTQAL